MPLNSPTIAVVVVTHNRKALLIRCLESLLTQSWVPDCIYIVDNASTDGTQELLAESEMRHDPRVAYLRLERNEGGAGGFHLGLREAVLDGYDYVWLMDDDCFPETDALAYLVEPLRESTGEIGFVCSHVVWTDGTPHRMNLPRLKLVTGRKVFSERIDEGLLTVPSCSFVSVLISSDAVEACGLPIRQMFIWGDDVEYTTRLTDAGFTGYYAWRSVVVHATVTNVNDDLLSARASQFFKFRFGIRNNLFNVRKRSGFWAFLGQLTKRLVVENIRLLRCRESRRWFAVWTNSCAAISSLTFRPEIEFICDRDRKFPRADGLNLPENGQ
ncbi:glycosyltransferase family 2 protein [Paraburkholderia bannensis]|uniref:glycosyltransferase family 2 protein n=1 Tax=Paraburkholderia bannensis TaxID=765414 RepID=UPI002AAFFCC9|nr:glycosyltransferase family 2 protein [Paraburkholderia bannensis]